MRSTIDWMAQRTPRKRRTPTSEDGFGGIVKGAALTRHQAAWRRVNKPGDISHMWKMGVWQRPDDWPDDDDNNA